MGTGFALLFPRCCRFSQHPGILWVQVPQECVLGCLECLPIDSATSLGSCSSARPPPWKEALPHGCGVCVGLVPGKKLCDLPSWLPARSYSGEHPKERGNWDPSAGESRECPARECGDGETPCCGEPRLSKSSQRPGAANIFPHASLFYPCLAQSRTFPPPRIIWEELLGFVTLYSPVSRGTVRPSRAPPPPRCPRW